LASFSFSNAFAAQQPNGFNQPNYRAHSNLKNHNRSENYGAGATRRLGQIARSLLRAFYVQSCQAKILANCHPLESRGA